MKNMGKNNMGQKKKINKGEVQNKRLKNMLIKLIETTNGNTGSSKIEVSDNTLILNNKIGETWIFTKVNDTEIDEYLKMEPSWK